MKKSYKNMQHAVFLLTGMTVGASILGLPIELGSAGLLPSLLGCFVVYSMMLISGLLLSKFFVKSNAIDLPTFFHQHLGNLGSKLFNLSYFTLAFCLLVAYWSGLKNMMQPTNFTCEILLLFACVIFLLLRRGLLSLSSVNSLFTVILLMSFFGLIAETFKFQSSGNLLKSNWKAIPFGMPILLCSFGYHQAIPAVCRLLDNNFPRICKAIILGTALPLVMNITILCASFRLISDKSNYFAITAISSQPIGLIFAFFAILTSLLGVSVALHGGLRDLLAKREKYMKTVELIVILPFFVAILHSDLFLSALSLSGGIFGNLIAGILPTCVAMRLRPKSILLKALLAGFLSILLIEIANILANF